MLEKKYDIVERASEVISSIIVTNEYKTQIKKILFDDINFSCSNNLEYIDKIGKIINNFKLFNSLEEEEQMKLYKILGNKYFLLGDMINCLESYQKSYELGDIKIISDIYIIGIIVNLDIFDDYKLIAALISSLEENTKLQGLDEFLVNLLLGQSINKIIEFNEDILDLFFKSNGDINIFSDKLLLESPDFEKNKNHFVSIAFRMIETFNNNNKYLDSINIYYFLEKVGFEDFNDEFKTLIGEAFLKNGEHYMAYTTFFEKISDNKLKNNKIADLLEDILLNVDFDIIEEQKKNKSLGLSKDGQYIKGVKSDSEDIQGNEILNPEIEIGMLLGKLKNDENLNVVDYESIKKLSNPYLY